MSVKIASAVIGDKGPRGMGPRMTLFLIAHQADDLGFYAEDVESIRVSLDCAKETVLRHLAQLETDGWLQIERRILAGRSSVYFINLEKLGVSIGDRPYKHKLWGDLERMREALGRGDKLSLQNRTLKFEKPPDGAGKVESGDLFSADFSGDNLPPQIDPAGEQSGEENAEKDDSGASEAENDADLVEKGLGRLAGKEISGGKLSPVRWQKPHLSGDNLSAPLTPVVEAVVEAVVSTPLPPQAGGEGFKPLQPETHSRTDADDGLVLPFSDPRPGEAGWQESAEVAARWAMERLGTTKRRMEPLLVTAFTLRLKSNREDTLAGAAVLAVQRYRRYVADFEQGLMTFPNPYKPERFFEFQRWERPNTWGYLRAPEAHRETTVGLASAPTEDEVERRERELQAKIVARIAEWAVQVEASGCAPAIAIRLVALAKLAGDPTMTTDELEERLTALDEEMFVLAQQTDRVDVAALKAQAEREVRPSLPRLRKEQVDAAIETRFQKLLFASLGLPRLGVFYLTT